MTFIDHLYLIECSTGHVKIGRSVSPKRRRMDLQPTVPGDLSLVMVLPGRGADEKATHARFADKRTHGEWFHDTPEIRQFFIDEGGVAELPVVPVSDSPVLREWSTINEAATLLGVSIDTLRRWDATGKLPAERDGNDRRVYSRRQIQKALATK